MGRMKEWAGYIREDERQREDDERYGYTTYAEAMFLNEQRRKRRERKAVPTFEKIFTANLKTKKQDEPDSK